LVKPEPPSDPFSAEDEEFFHSGPNAPESERPVTLDQEPPPATQVRVLGSPLHRSRFIRPVAQTVATLAVIAGVGLARSALRSPVPPPGPMASPAALASPPPPDLQLDLAPALAAEPVETLMSCAPEGAAPAVAANETLFGPPAPPDGVAPTTPAPAAVVASSRDLGTPGAKGKDPAGAARHQGKRAHPEPMPSALRLALVRKTPPPKKSVSTSALLGAIRASRPHS
jgi:hypothetical protein